jgi:hypothetical protein
MDCLICANLERAYEARLSEYVEARTSVCYRVSTKLAAKRNVDMERARYELEEHRSACVLKRTEALRLSSGVSHYSPSSLSLRK